MSTRTSSTSGIVRMACLAPASVLGLKVSPSSRLRLWPSPRGLLLTGRRQWMPEKVVSFMAVN